jgi:hypothetical protein
MTDKIARACETCKHEQKSAVDNPCRNCLPSPRLPSWQPAEVEQTPAARIAELEAEVAKLREALKYYTDAIIVADWDLQEYEDDGLIARQALGLPEPPEAE